MRCEICEGDGWAKAYYAIGGHTYEGLKPCNCDSEETTANRATVARVLAFNTAELKRAHVVPGTVHRATEHNYRVQLHAVQDWPSQEAAHVDHANG